MKYQELTDRIICCFYNVYNGLGYGFLEKVYEKSLLIELAQCGVSAEPQAEIEVSYSGLLVGHYFADLVIENKVIVEIKAAKTILPQHEAQLLNYLKATDIEVDLLLNFGPRPEVKRKVLDNGLK